MATVYVNPAATDMSSNASYLNGVDGSSIGSLPTSGDTLVFYAGDAAITAGFAALAAVDFAEVIVLPQCRKPCSTPLQLMVSHSGGPGKLTYRGSASEFKVMADGDGIDSAVIEPNSGRFEADSDGAATWAHVTVAPGNVTFAATARVTNWTCAGGKLHIVDSGNTWTLGVVTGGEVTDFRGGANVIMGGSGRSGIYRPMKDAAISGEVRVNAGVFNPRTTGTIAKVVGTGGTVTPEGAPGNVTITNADYYGTASYGVTVFEEAAGAKIVHTNSPIYYGTVAPQKSTGSTGFGDGA